MLKEKIRDIKERGQELSSDTKKEILTQIEKLSKMIDEKKKKLMEKFD